MAKKVIITGISGQDGSYMAEYILKNTDNIVVGGIRRTSQAILSNLTAIIDHPRFKLITADLCDGEAIRSLIREEKPDYFINFGAQTFVKDSWKHPVAHMMTNAISLIYIYEAIREYCPACRVYSAGSSEQWGDVKYNPQDENHPMSPRSIYGVSKCAASHITKVYRESYGLYAIHGVLLNHESERRQDYFVTRKITKGVARIVSQLKKVTDKDGNITGEANFAPIELGNVDSYRDWSHAEDFVDGVWRMLNQEEYNGEKAIGYFTEGIETKFLSKYIKEYVLSSNETHSIREFVITAFEKAGYKGQWVGKGLDEKFVIFCGNTSIAGLKDKYFSQTPVYAEVVKINPEFYRPADVELLHGDSSAIRRDLGWEPKNSFSKLVERMVNHDLVQYIMSDENKTGLPSK
jgi:GDPmannose 4,6-dehydratase